MGRVDGSLAAGGNLVRGLLTGTTAAAAAVLLSACVADGPGVFDTVNNPDWGVVVETQDLADGTRAVRLGSCVMISGRLYLATPEQLEATLDPNSGITLVSEGIVESADGAKTHCATDIHALHPGGYAKGEVVGLPPQPVPAP